MSDSSAASPITVAVAGLGRAGWDMHVKQMMADDRFKIVDAMDPESARREEARAQLACQTHETFEAMLAATAAEVVVVASPSNLHGRHTVAALSAGRHVIVEKPFALNVAEADLMIAAAKQSGRQLLVHQNHRFGKVFAFLNQVIASKKLGRIFHFALIQHGYRLRTDWQTVTRHGGGELNNSGSHYLDMVLRLLDSPVKDLLCDMKHVADSGDAEDQVKIFLRAENGVTADIEISTKAATTRHAPLWTILGDAGALTIDQGQAHLKYYDRSQVPPPQPQGTLAATGRKYTPEPVLPWVEEDLAAETAVDGTFYENVFRTIRQGAPFRVKLAEARQVVDTIARCRQQNPAFPGATPV